MQTEPEERRRQSGRSGSGRAERRRTHTQRAAEEERTRTHTQRAAEEERTRTHTHTHRAAARSSEDEITRGRKRGGGGGGWRRAASEGGGDGEEEEEERLRWRISQLEKEKLELTSGHNQELCRLQTELTRLRSSVERGEAQRAELQYQLTVAQRDAERVAELSGDKQALTERASELQQKVQELQKVVDITRRGREEDQHALQQDVEERDKLIHSFGSENQRLHRLLQEQEEALEEVERRMAEVQKESEKEAEVKRRQADELKYLKEREDERRKEKELGDQRMKSLQSSIESERAAHLESKFNSEIIQLRVRDLEAVLVTERSGQQEAQQSLELLRSQFREVERAYSLERERRDGTERAQERLQKELDQCKSDLTVTLETERRTTSDLTERLEEEKRRHADSHSQLEQAAQKQSDTEETFISCLKQIRETLRQHGCSPAAKDHGNLSLSEEVVLLLKSTLSADRHRQEETDRQVQDLVSASEKLQEENQTLKELNSDHSKHTEESQQAALRLQEEVTRLLRESSEWSTQSRELQAELEREREEREREKEKEKEGREKEREKEREEWEREREEREREKEERTAEVQKMIDLYQEESKVRLSFLYCLYQRLLAGCVLLNQSQSILGNFTWEELCDVISEQVDQLTSDLRRANNKVAHLQSVCEKKSVCVRELKRSQECVLSRVEESVRKREEAWSSQHTHTVTQLQNELQLCRSQCDSLRDHVSSAERQRSSLTSDLLRLQSLLSRSREESSSLLSACSLLAGATAHALLRLQELRQQKALLSRRLQEREQLEEEVRRLAGALGGEEEEEEEGQRRRRRRSRAVRRWRRSVCVVLAVRRWRALAKQTTVLFRLERDGDAVSVCYYGNETTATQRGQTAPNTDKDDDDDDEGDEGRGKACARWLRSKYLSSAILSSMSDLQGALTHTGSSPPDVMSAARSAMSRLLDHLLSQSDAAPRSGEDEQTLTGRLRLGLNTLTPPRPDMKVYALVSSLQQHFLLFSQRLHSAEVERRGLRLEVANLKRARRREREVPAERFQSVCVELRQALSREQEAQTLIQEQTTQMQTLQLRVNTHAEEQEHTQHTLSQNEQSLLEARQEVSRKERSLRTLGKHLSGVQREQRHLEEKLQRAEEELRDAARRKDCLIGYMNAAERSYTEVRESLVQSRHSLSAQSRPPPLPREHLETNGAESIMGTPEVAACQSLLSSFSQLYHSCSSRIGWLEQEVSAHRSHVTALRGELQDACLRDNLAFVPVEFPEVSPFADGDALQSAPLFDWLKEPPVTLKTGPAPSSPPLCKPSIRTGAKEKKDVKKSREHVKSGGRK
ncbi:coiled-coil domain-containing protein 171-like [Scomber scombrus]|uniref:Coiled-coil domain-containing protein 171-like n=1 Tax=Scomber scombrus TaxID=13677 RepID=A0AAV1Q830_SCOSC